MHELSGFQRDALFVINGMAEPSGQDIKEVLEEYYESDINHGRLYPNLDTLVNKGFVEKGEIDRRTNFYRISERGVEAIRRRREWEAQHLDTEE